MERVWKVINLEVKRKRFLASVMIYLALMLGILFLSYFASRSLGTINMKDIPQMYLQIIPFIILVNCSFSLTQEFANKTDKIIFTGIFTRNEVMASKLVSFLIVAIIAFGFYEFTSIICNTFNSNMIISNLISFLVYTFTLGSFILLVSVITTNFIITGIVGYVLYFDLILALLKQVLVSSTNETIKYLITKLPFYIANTGFSLGSYTPIQFIIMASSGILFLGLACVIINRKNM